MPTTEEEKDELFEAGLGEKEILFDELDLPAEEFKKVVLHSFPQLCQAVDISFVSVYPILGN